MCVRVPRFSLPSRSALSQRTRSINLRLATGSTPTQAARMAGGSLGENEFSLPGNSQAIFLAAMEDAELRPMGAEQIGGIQGQHPRLARLGGSPLSG